MKSEILSLDTAAKLARLDKAIEKVKYRIKLLENAIKSEKQNAIGIMLNENLLGQYLELLKIMEGE